MTKQLKPKSDFNRNVLTLMTGATIAQAIPIAITPILTRLYTPEDFGLLALFVSITVIFGAIANARYELAIMLPEKDSDVINIAALGLLITIVLSTTLLINVVIFNLEIVWLLGNDDIGLWLYFVPFMVLLIGLYNVLNYLNIRKKLYQDVAKSNVYKSIAMSIVQLVVGFIKVGASGLILGQMVAHVAANYRLLKNTAYNFDLKQVSRSSMVLLAKRYINFPKYSMPAILANTLSTHLVNILIPIIFSIATLGFYSIAQRMLGMPSSIIGTAIGQVFFQEATKEKLRTGRAVQAFNSTLTKLLILTLPIFGVIFFIIEDVFVIAFGEDWRVAGVYAQILLPLFAFRFVSSTLSCMLTVFEKLKSELIINFILICISIFVVISFEDFMVFLYTFSFFMSLAYFCFSIYYMKLSRGGA